MVYIIHGARFFCKRALGVLNIFSIQDNLRLSIMKKIRKFFYFKSLKYGVITILFALIPVTLAIIFIEFLIDIKPYDTQLRNLEVLKDYSLNALIYYVVMGLVHMVICFIIAQQFCISTNKDSTLQKTKAIKALFNYLEFEDLIIVNPFRKMQIKIKEPVVLREVMDINEVIKIFKKIYYKKTKIVNKNSYP